MKKPNILLVFTDQQRYDTIEALGNPVIKTPALNKLVENGVAFTHAYSPCPVCIPARHALHSGQMPHRTGCTFNSQMPDGHTSFMEVLSENGYQTHGVGKMHFSFKEKGKETMWGYQSRDFFEEVWHSPRNDYKRYLQEVGFTHVDDLNGMRSEMYYIPQLSQLPAKHHNTTWTVDRSIDFLENRDEDKPFFMMTSFVKPHPPFETPTPWNKLYRGPEMPLPKRPEDEENLRTFWNKLQNRYKFRDQGTDNNLVRCMKAAYYSAISFIDYNLNRLLEHMEESGLMEDTLIIFTADHGEMLGDYNCYGKRNFFDSAARVPMLMYYKGAQKGQRCDTPVSLVDIFPTFMQAAGIDYDGDLSGESLMDIANGQAERDMVCGQYHHDEYGMYMCVTDRYKYIYSAPDDKEYLYDRHVDPEETKNRAYNALYQHITEELRHKLIAYYREEGYEEPLDGDEWKKCTKKELPDDPDALFLVQDPRHSIPNIPGYERGVGLQSKGLNFADPLDFYKGKPQS